MCSRRLASVLLVVLFLLVMLLLVTGAVLRSALGPSRACSAAATGPVQPGTSARTLASGGLQRCYLLYTPPGYDGTQPLPVVFSLHGFASSARGQQRIRRWNDIADREGFIVVYPEGTSFPLRWNSSAAFFAGSVDDVQFLRDVVADLARVANIDRARIYLSGMSNGGAMANRVACEAADTIAAIGTVAAVPYEIPGTCTPSRPVPVIAFHGTADPLVSYSGGTHRILVPRGWLKVPTMAFDYAPIESWIAGWAKRNGCHMVPDSIPARGDASGIHYTDCEDNADVVLYTIEGGGHTWPGGIPLPLVGRTSTDIDASETMWAFFEAHPRER